MQETYQLFSVLEAKYYILMAIQQAGPRVLHHAANLYNAKKKAFDVRVASMF